MGNNAYAVVIMGTLQRTIEKFLSQSERDVPYCSFDGQKLLVGVKSKHRTRSGVKYNNLIRLMRRNEHNYR